MESPEFKEIPISVLRGKTRELICNSLNPCKILLSPEGFRRDYRGLANSANIPLPPCNHLNPTSFVLKKWESLADPSLFQFIQTLQLIDRWDIIDDVIDLIKEDVLAFSQKKSELPEVTSTPSVNLRSDQQFLTTGDVERGEEGLPPEIYDAFLLYSDDDAEFVDQLLEELEGQRDLKLCLKDRDLLGGITFEHEAIMRLISERCRRVIVIYSPSFLESPANKFIVSYAQAIGIEQGDGKIVPCIYKRVDLPRELRYYFCLDFNRYNSFGNFWSKLSLSIKAPKVVRPPERRALPPSVTVTELPPSVTVNESPSSVTEPPPDRLSPSSWDCPSKTSKESLPAIEAGSSRSDGASASPVSQLSAAASIPQKKSKVRSMITSLFPSPPTEKPGKTRFFRKKKKKVKTPALG